MSGGSRWVWRCRLHNESRWKKWKVEKDARLEARFDGQLRRRHVLFVRRFVAGVAQRIGDRPTEPVSKAEARTLARTAASEAGYLRAAEGETLLQMPRIQAGIERAFIAADLPIEESARIISEIARDKENKPETRLQAVELRHKLTTGFAPARAQNVNVNAKADALFNEEMFRKVGPPSPVKGQDKPKKAT